MSKPGPAPVPIPGGGPQRAEVVMAVAGIAQDGGLVIVRPPKTTTPERP